jgi:hypothetical protein
VCARNQKKLNHRFHGFPRIGFLWVQCRASALSAVSAVKFFF